VKAHGEAFLNVMMKVLTEEIKGITGKIMILIEKMMVLSEKMVIVNVRMVIVVTGIMNLTERFTMPIFKIKILT
jgi:hypothetical protein